MSEREYMPEAYDSIFPDWWVDRSRVRRWRVVTPEHVYTSTACQHGLHDHCRRTCKFCEARCRCYCHVVRGFYKPWEKP